MNADKRRQAKRAKRFGKWCVVQDGRVVVEGNLDRVHDWLVDQFGREAKARSTSRGYEVLDGWTSPAHTALGAQPRVLATVIRPG